MPWEEYLLGGEKRCWWDNKPGREGMSVSVGGGGKGSKV